ncbi:MAG: hydantoinase/oxoprolinase family protein [Acidimicrobiales bacterium]
MAGQATGVPAGGIRLDRTGCIGVDVGGTFTDAVLTDGVGVWRAKSPSTPGNVGEGVLRAVELAAARAGAPLEQILPSVSRFGLGTTAVTNVLASRAGRRVGLVTTAGFEELVPFSRGRKIMDEDGWLTPPPEIVSPHCIVGVRERVDRDGRVVTPLERAEVAAAARHLVQAKGVEALAVSFLWSFRNPTHEQEAVREIEEVCPEVPVVSGAALHPAVREFERTTFALLNAYVTGAFEGIEQLEEELARRGLEAPLLLVHSAGGSITVAEARRVPVGLAESGPAAGVAASAALAQAEETPDVVTCDMGGTSLDVSVITGGTPVRRTRGELMGVWTALSLIDVESIGAGGGSVGWVDSRGMLRVGPRSAGAVPGPACYGRGGTTPTVTDALVVLGFLDPGRFLGGEMSLDVEAAAEACARLGGPLGMDADETAWGIRQVATAGMVKAVRSRLAARGLDPRQQVILSFGGCGGLFTPAIGEAIGSRRVLVPALASVLSAFGAATADVRRERIRAVLEHVPFDPALLEKVAVELAAEVDADLAADHIPPADRSVSFEADLRFKRQIWELPIPLPSATPDEGEVLSMVETFKEEYARRYGRGSIVLGAPVELVSLRAVGSGRTVRASFQAGHAESVADGTRAEPVGSRSVRLERGAGGTRAVAVYDGESLVPGHALDGPALIDGSDSTVFVPEHAALTVSPQGTFVVEFER